MQGTQNGILNTLATALVAYAVANIQINYVQALIAGLIGLGIYLLKEFLKTKGINIGSLKRNR